MADDLSAENLACYGNAVYSTPHLDRVAAEGLKLGNTRSKAKKSLVRITIAIF
ncbi:MAG: hypothetical protein M2R45_02956 [Verrucomicrobia subdivision 3 bacterium]|nr:hypothetical protein [Limisphaerales bacterium]MCS1415324.1 hypothetical protein [Limisphaerales bacterium]